MRVLDHEPSAWFLLEDNGELLLDVNYSHGVVSYSVTITLDASERARYTDGGHGYPTKLAAKVQNSAPAARNSSSPYTDRDMSRSRELSDAIMAAITAWRT